MGQGVSLSHDAKHLTAVETKVLEALPPEVDLDLAQVTSRAGLMPSQTRGALKRLATYKLVETVHPLASSKRPRFKRRLV